MSIYMDVSGCCLNDSLPGGNLFLRKVLQELSTKKGLSVVLLAYDARTGLFDVLDKDKVLDEVAPGSAKRDDSGLIEVVGVDDMRHGDVFVDFGAAFGNGWRRSELYPRLKQSGVKIVSYVHTLAPYSAPCEFEPVFVVNFLYYVGALLQHADIVMAPDRNILDGIDGLRREIGLRMVPEYPAAPEEIAAIIVNAAKNNPLVCFANLFRNKRVVADKRRSVDDGSAGIFSDYYLGSPIRLYLPCNDGISIKLSDYIWTEGNAVNIRLKISGSFRRGLCLKMDFTTLFNSRQRAVIYANEVKIEEMEACGNTTRTIPIPASCLGDDRNLTIHMELPNAVAPCELNPSISDTRLLALCITEMRIFDEDPYFACRGGEPLYFAENDGAVAAQYCLAGVSRPEKGFTWTDGDVVTMRFCPFDFNGTPKSITLHYKTFLPEEHVGVVVNDIEIANYVARGEEKKTLALPPNCVSPDGFVMVSIRLPDAISPYELSQAPDHRRLALQLFTVQLD